MDCARKSLFVKGFFVNRFVLSELKFVYEVFGLLLEDLWILDFRKCKIGDDF